MSKRLGLFICSSKWTLILLFLTASSSMSCHSDRVEKSLQSFKSISLALSAEPKTFNPLLIQETASGMIAQFLFDGLIDWDPINQKAEASLAESWEVNDEGTAYTFKLAKDLKWSDGTPLRASDVAFTYEECIFNKNLPIPIRDFFNFDEDPIEVSILNDLEIKFSMSRPRAFFLQLMTQPIVPKHLLSTAVTDGSFASIWGTDVRRDFIAGTGPFILDQYDRGSIIRLKRNPFYRKNTDAQKSPILDYLFFQLLPNADSRMLKFMDGSLDLFSPRPEDLVFLKDDIKTGRVKIRQDSSQGSMLLLAFNEQNNNETLASLFKQSAFRQAVSLAINREELASLVYFGYADPQCSPLPMNSPFRLQESTCSELNLEDARTQLKEAFEAVGHSSEPISFTIMTNAEAQDRVQIAAMLRKDLMRLGLDVNLRIVEFQSMVSSLLGGADWDAVLIGLTGTHDPHFGGNVWKSTGRLHFWNQQEVLSDWQERIDQLFSQGSLEMNLVSRRDLYLEWQRIFEAELPVILTVEPKAITLIRPNIKVIKNIPGRSIFQDVDEWDIAP